jgi:uncharacterized protein (TIGR00266 family)
MSSNIKLMNIQNSNKNKTQYKKTKNNYKNNSKNNNENNNNSKYVINKTNISLIKNSALFLKENKNYPIFSYEGGDGFQCVKFNLKPQQAIRADAGTMNYMTSNITINTTTGNMWSAVGRMFSGSSFFYNIFTNEGKNNGTINFSGINPGNIGAFYIPKGQSLNLVSDSYVCSTPNLIITTNVRFGGVLLGYGLTFVHIEAIESDGIVWGASFGNVIEKKIKPNESLKINNGVIMGFESNTEIHTNTIGGFTSTFFSGEGFISNITNTGKKPLRMFLQSRSKTAYLRYLKNILHNRK